MSLFVESLEARTLFSAAPSIAALKAEDKIILADLAALGKVGATNIKLIEAALKTANELKSSKDLRKTLSVEGSAAFAVTSRDVKRTVALIASDVSRLVAFASQLAKHPTSGVLQAKVTTAVGILQADASNRLTTITNDITNEQATNAANIASIETYIPSSVPKLFLTTTISENANNAGTALTDAVTTALTADQDAVVAAFTT